MRVGIVGLGLIGGSMGLCLKKTKIVSSIVGYDINKQNEEDALNLGLVGSIMDIDDMKKNCDIIFLAVPVEAIIKITQSFGDIDENLTIVELGSTKVEILSNVPSIIRKNFVAAHPMSGTEFSGPMAAKEDLFKDAVMVLCDMEQNSEIHRRRIVEIASHIGMKIVFMSATEHDHHAAIISHITHVISFSLANSVMKEEDIKHILALRGGSFSDMIRTAKSSPEMWSDIFKQNSENILFAINMFRKELDICENLIKHKKWDELRNWMSEARKIREIL
ncbi:prephenate dehydrogenase [Campylobacter sputorum subsp. bubulus]|uniref:Prephenate dehydrogenase n=1 Tax=Campylobacter sputorum subsp. sputorum TaxID=32024 RepID=A0A381DKB0_9BACT|nr:prephenate dehydrogenase [Campylobacter sputorum]ASM34471.1 chorismate mutase / prephenate dehydrogenase [Campylobacter sputorum aubsp. sputorum RM3237]ASM36136.1 chorismate mutase / prephenate dehydrogenase [Campylobacter sputorum bv. faecalis CCUG 20703]KAB0582141.1 prephenate dehydrogenase [Campylobacter sputorum subsp. sputorum]QEL04662.1 chorismate mutase / prephenate dehydrogenase [Campylobacter sputorum subsp. sputorum]SUX09499.1 prephenate dehydrogenase [Campylobacter sputorum subsp